MEARVSVDGYDKVWVYAFESVDDFDSPEYRKSLAQTFSIYADYSVEQYPTLFTVGNVVFMVRGVDHDILTKLLTSLWHLRPTEDIAPFGIPEFGNINEEEAKAKAVEWFTDPARGTDAFTDVTDVEARLVRFGDYTVWSGAEDNWFYVRLPYPDTAVWLVKVDEGMAGMEAQRFGVIVLDYYTGILVSRVVDRTAIPL